MTEKCQKKNNVVYSFTLQYKIIEPTNLIFYFPLKKIALPPPVDCVLHVFWKKMTWKCWLVFFSNALYTYAPRCRTILQKDGWEWVYKSNRSHLLVKHTNIMYIYFFNFKSHFNWNMLIGCFLIDIARLIEKWVKIMTEIGVFIRGEKMQLVNFVMWLLSRKRLSERERERERERESTTTWK